MSHTCTKTPLLSIRSVTRVCLAPHGRQGNSGAVFSDCTPHFNEVFVSEFLLVIPLFECCLGEFNDTLPARACSGGKNKKGITVTMMIKEQLHIGLVVKQRNVETRFLFSRRHCDPIIMFSEMLHF